MKRFLLPLTCVILLLGNICRGDDLPFFSALREEIVNRLTIATNTVPPDKKLASSLLANLKLIDKTKPTFITGSVASTADRMMLGSRVVGALSPGATSAGTVNVVIPSTLTPGTYFVLACADDVARVKEAGGANNCRASATAVSVTP